MTTVAAETPSHSSYQIACDPYWPPLSERWWGEPISIRTVKYGDIGYDAVRVNVAVVEQPEGAAVPLFEPLDPFKGMGPNLIERGYWGPAEGAPIGPNFKFSGVFLMWFPKPGTYRLRLALYDVLSEQELTAEIFTFEVEKPIGN